jgi:predicted DCC family thiol-disulfide oxidoreductase YuxK
MPNEKHPVLLYDGVCGLCNRLVQFILRHDRAGAFRFASLQSDLAARILARHGRDVHDLDTMYVVVNHDAPAEALFARSDAVRFVFTQLGGIWRASAIMLKLLPHSLCDFTYNAIARRRYRIFGRSETCILPAPENRARFLDVE